MALDGLTALANTGGGTDVLAGRSAGGKFIGAAMLTNEFGVEINEANPLPIAPPSDVDVGAAASIAAINTNLLTGVANSWFDAAKFHSVSIQIIGGGGISAGQIFFEQTNSITAAPNGNPWLVNEELLTPTPVNAALAITASTVRMFGGAVTCRYVRVRVSTAFAGGTVQAAATFSQLPYFRQVQTVHQATAANLNATVAQATATNLQANVRSIAVTPTDRSNTITAGGTAQVAIALNAGRRAYWILNTSAGDLWISDVGTATAASPSLRIPPNGLYESLPGNCPTNAISIIGATTAQSFAAREYT